MKTHLTLITVLSLASLQVSAQTIYEHTFDGVANDDTPPDIQGFSNGVGGATSDLVTGVCGGGGTSATGFNTTAAIDLSAYDAFTVEFVVENNASAIVNSRSNGAFFGISTDSPTANGTVGTALYNNVGTATLPSIGLQVGATKGGPGPTEFVIDSGGQSYTDAGNAFVDDDTDGYTIFVTYAEDTESGNTSVTITSSGLASNLNFNTVAAFTYSSFISVVTPNVSSQGGSIDLSSIRILEPDTTDSDDDDLLDSWELIQTGVTDLEDLDGKILVLAGSGSMSGDFDGDLLLDIDEYNNFTDAGDEDSDDDLLFDGEEVHGTLNPYQTDVAGDVATSPSGLPTDPLDADSDDDDLTDFEELDNGNGSITNPNTNDTDGDFLLDIWEIDNVLDPTSSMGDDGDFGDPDMDLLDNFGEQAAGTDPNEPHSDSDTLNDGEEDTLGTNPLDPDTDGDNLDDGAEADEASVTDPLNADSDFDTFLDSVEIAAGTNPNDPNPPEVPTLATITWTATEMTSEFDLITNGPLVLAENCNGPAATVNGIPFASAIDETTFRSTANFVTLITNNAGADNFYDDEDPALSPLLESIWTASTDPTVSVFGLTPGLPYVIQVGRADDRNSGSIMNRFYTIDGVGGENAADPVGSTNTIFGGSSNPAILFTGSFIASESVQSFEINQYNTGADTISPGANVINFIQVRQTDDLTTGGPSLPVRVASSGFNGTAFEITFENLDPTKTYQLVRSEDLRDDFPTVVDGPRTPTGGATSDIFSDASVTLPGKGFYVLEEVTP